MQTGKKPLKERYFTCPYCDTYQDRDVNASINILRLGLDQAMANNWTSVIVADVGHKV
ncbi:MAG: transposase [Acetilactobacillus jinshanensis]